MIARTCTSEYRIDETRAPGSPERTFVITRIAWREPYASTMRASRPDGRDPIELPPCPEIVWSGSALRVKLGEPLPLDWRGQTHTMPVEEIDG